MSGIEPAIPPLPTPPQRSNPGEGRRPTRQERMRDEPPPPPPIQERGALVPPELDLIDPDAGNKTDVVALRMREQHCRYLTGLREAVSIRKGVSKRVIDEAIVMLIRAHRDELLDMVTPMSKPERIVDVDSFLGDA